MSIRISGSFLKIERILFFAITACLPLAYISAQASNLGSMPEGIAIIVSKAGKLSITSEDGNKHPSKMHTHISLTGKRMQTGDEASAFIKLSNGITIGIGEKTTVLFENYQQAFFSKAEESLSEEPSQSKCSIRLLEGTIAIAAENLSPLSEIFLPLEGGTLRIHGAVCLINRTSVKSEITTYEGSLTYYYPAQNQREFISKPLGISLNADSVAQSKPLERFTSDALPPAALSLIQKTLIFNDRAFFRAGTPNKAAEPFLLVPQAYFDREASRPYSFEKRDRLR